MSRYFIAVALLLCTLLLPSCALFEPGGPSAAANVRARTSFQAGEVVERVFVDHGYEPILRESDGTTFEKKGSKMDRLFYGDWNDEDVTERVKVVITSKGEGHYRLRCVPFMTRFPHDVSFEDQHRRPQLFSLKYGRLLREVRGQCEELWKSREGE
jgi:hypothetical protein